MAYDSARGQVVLFGGISSDGQTYLADTWVWDGANWSLWTGRGPSFRRYHGMAFDSARGRTEVFAGWGNGTVFNDTWENGLKGNGNGFSPMNPASVTPFGTGCPGSGGTPALGSDQGSLPWIGQTFTARLANLGISTALNRPFLILGDSNAPLELSPLGMPGCSLYANPLVTLPLTNQGGTATWSVPIPNDPSYVGVSLYTQGFVTSPGSNPLGMVVSNACELRLGAK